MNKDKFTPEEALKETNEIFEITFKEFCIRAEKENVDVKQIKNTVGYFFHSGCVVGMRMAEKKISELLNK